MLAVTVALLVIAAAVLVARGTHLLSLSQDASRSGLRPASASYSIVDNEFVSATTGWILIQMHTTSGPDVLMKTSDGGKHWVEQFRYTGKGGIDSIHFSRNGLDGTMSWVEGGAVAVSAGSAAPPAATPTLIKTYQTHDGGAHWQLAFTTTEDNPLKTAPQPEYAPGFASAAFYLDNDREGWSIRMPLHPATHDTLVMHTSDSGKSWSQIGVLPGTENCQPFFSDAKNGWCTVYQFRTVAFDSHDNPLPSASPPALLEVTHDGGYTWAPASVQLPAGATNTDTVVLFNQPVMLDARRGFLVMMMQPMLSPAGPNPPAQAPSMSFVVRTIDGGDHWMDIQSLPNSAKGSGVLFLSDNHWLVGNGPLLQETTDGGSTWSSRRVLSHGTLSLASWDFIPPSTIWSQVDAGALIRSTDGGRTWEAVTPPAVH
jgi:photosystem II stability/assembly factor-like uncharacterized protein